MTKGFNGHPEFRCYAVDNGQGFVKIGRGRYLQDRIYELQVGSPYPLTLIASFPMSLESERDLHRRFADKRVLGEWFADSDGEIRRHMLAVADREGPHDCELDPDCRRCSDGRWMCHFDTRAGVVWLAENRDLFPDGVARIATNLQKVAS